jgi:hypothetical protein
VIGGDAGAVALDAEDLVIARDGVERNLHGATCS